MDPARTAIPRILHQTWKENTPPAEWDFAVQSWTIHHPDWSFRWWSDSDNDAFVKEVFPEFLPVWQNFTFPIQRADAIRYLFLYHHGGVYADLDLESLRPLDPLLQPGTFLAGWEPEKHIRDSGQPLFCNAFMAAPPGHPFLKHILDHLQTEEPRVNELGKILESTGPAFLNRMLETYHGTDVLSLPSDAFYPITAHHAVAGKGAGSHPSRSRLVRKCTRKGSYGIHYWSNAWVREQHGELCNPDPGNVHGFLFFQGIESPDGDAENVGRVIQDVAEHCRQNPKLVGFNTSGNVKTSLHPRWKWVRLPYAGPNEGLYVKPEHCPTWTPVGALKWAVLKAGNLCRHILNTLQGRL